MVIAAEHLNAMFSHAERVAPEECCGWLELDPEGAVTAVHEAENTAMFKQGRYEIDERSRVDLSIADDHGSIAIYHSHPMGWPAPSMIDVNEATLDVPYVIVAPRERQVRVWWLTRDVAEEPLEIVPDAAPAA